MACEYGASDDFLIDSYNSAAKCAFIYGVKNPSGYLRQWGFTWDEFVNTYDTIQNSQFNAVEENIELTGVNENSYYWTNHNGNNKEYYDNLNSIFTVKNYSGNSFGSYHPLGWYADNNFLISCEEEIMNMPVEDINNSEGKRFSMFSNYFGSKYINYDGKALISDPIWVNKLVVIGSISNSSEHIKKIMISRMNTAVNISVI